MEWFLWQSGVIAAHIMHAAHCVALWALGTWPKQYGICTDTALQSLSDCYGGMMPDTELQRTTANCSAVHSCGPPLHHSSMRLSSITCSVGLVLHERESSIHSIPQTENISNLPEVARKACAAFTRSKRTLQGWSSTQHTAAVCVTSH